MLRSLALLPLLVVLLAASARAQFVDFCWGDGSNPVACPCANVGSANHGCPNSQNASGGGLAVAGAPSPDTIVFTASALVPSALAVLVQADSRSPVSGVAYGDGIDCMFGNRHVLFRKSAATGSATFPGAGDPSISARSAVLGDTIPQGGFRYYQVVYRDKTPAFCSAPTGGTWNITNMIMVAW